MRVKRNSHTVLSPGWGTTWISVTSGLRAVSSRSLAIIGSSVWLLLLALLPLSTYVALSSSWLFSVGHSPVPAPLLAGVEFPIESTCIPDDCSR